MRWAHTTLAIAAILSAKVAHAQDITSLGGDLTNFTNANTVALELPAANISSEERFNQHLDSHADFHGSVEFLTNPNDGKPILGPLFNHVSCGGCHFKDGRGSVKFNKSGPGSPMLIKVSLKGLKANGAPRDVPKIGEQLLDHSTKDDKRDKFHSIKLKWKQSTLKYGDGEKYKLRRPDLSFVIPGVKPSKVVHSLRQTPSTIGMGLLNAVDEGTMLAMEDPDDLDNDGISGEINWVLNAVSGNKEPGKFGWRASHPNLAQQTAAALVHDMGVRNPIFPGEGGSEITQALFDSLVFYQQVPGLTPARDQDDPDVMAGKALFQSVGCDDCHKMTLQTGDSEHPELVSQTFHPFTDLLLHDMGKGLSDKRKEFSASGREWRTTPLWGLGLAEDLAANPNAIGFLHDGRARNLAEAILWHGGEGEASKEAFRTLPKAQREQLIKFLKSL